MVRDQEVDVRQAVVSDEDVAVARLAYGAGATITRLNKGLRRRANKKVLEEGMRRRIAREVAETDIDAEA